MATKTCGPQVARGVDELPQHRKRARDDLDRLGEAGHGERAVVANETAARGLEARTAEPEDLRVGHPLPQFGRQRTRIHVA